MKSGATLEPADSLLKKRYVWHSRNPGGVSRTMKMEKFQKYAAVAEIVSAVAIVISLVYVGYEFRRTQTLSSNDVDKILFERVQEMNGMLIQVPDLANLVLLAQNRSSEKHQSFDPL